jgi:hypothetical protein
MSSASLKTTTDDSPEGKLCQLAAFAQRFGSAETPLRVGGS